MIKTVKRGYVYFIFPRPHMNGKKLPLGGKMKKKKKTQQQKIPKLSLSIDSTHTFFLMGGKGFEGEGGLSAKHFFSGLEPGQLCKPPGENNFLAERPPSPSNPL